MGERLAPDLVDAFIAALNLRPRGWAPGDTANDRIQEGTGEGGRTFRALVSISGSRGAMPALSAYRTDIGMTSRAPSAEELAAFRTAFGLEGNAMPQEVVLALDGLAVVVHSENDVQSLTLDQVRDIYAGQITNWSQVGGADRPIRLYARENPMPPGSSSTRRSCAAVLPRRRSSVRIR